MTEGSRDQVALPCNPVDVCPRRGIGSALLIYLTAHPQTEALVLSGDSTNHSHRANAEGFPKLYGLLFDLLGQLTSRGQDDSIRTLIRVLDPAAQTGGSKAESLASTPTRLMLSFGYFNTSFGTCRSWAGW